MYLFINIILFPPNIKDKGDYKYSQQDLNQN